MKEWVETTFSSPYLDSESDTYDNFDGDDEAPFVGSVEGSGAQVRTCELNDTPGARFPLYFDTSYHAKSWAQLPACPGGFWLLRSIGGQIKLLAGLSARTRDAPQTYLTFSLTTWCLEADLQLVSMPGSHQVAGQGHAVHLSTRVLTNQCLLCPCDARTAGLEIFGPQATGDDEDAPINYATNEWLPVWL
jgi:hypothetical protein